MMLSGVVDALYGIPRARIAPRERDFISPLPTELGCFYFLRLATARLFDNIGRLESELTRQRAAPA